VGAGLGFEQTRAFRDEIREFAETQPVAMAQVTIPLRSSSCPEGVCDLFLFPGLDPEEDDYAISAAVFAMKPRSRGSLRLRSQDPREPLAIDHGFLVDERDADVLTEGIDALRKLVATGPVSRFVAREIRPGAGVTAATHARSGARGFFHPTGTCALGRVVDGDGTVLGFENLHVADASIMPTIPRANTNLTVAAIAEKLAVSLAAT
jgi:choline dehydrogenase